MRPRIRTLLALAAALATVLLVPNAAGADSGGDDDSRLLDSQLVGSTPPAVGGPVLFGVIPGGAPWVIDESRVRVSRDGKLKLRVEGLVIPGRGTATVTAVRASLVCNGMVGTATAAVPLTADGDARIRTTVVVPAPCLAPAVLVHPNSIPTAYIAANG